MAMHGNHGFAFRGTPSVPGTGWFDRNGIERPLHGHLGENHGKHEGKPYSRVTAVCTRCGGAGGSDKWAHTGWKCYDCGGTGTGKSYPARLYTAAQLATLNERRDAIRAKKAAKRAQEAAEREAADDKARAERAAMLAADPFYVELKALMATFKTATVQDADWDADDKRPLVPDFLRDMFKTIQVRDLSEKQRAAVQKFIDTHKAKERRKANSAFVAEIGKRIEIKAKVLYTQTIHYSEGYWDPARYLLKFETADGQMLTWFTQKFYEKGVTVIGKATVKDHREYNGQKETQITNFRVKDVIEAGEDKQIEAALEAAAEERQS